MPHSTTRRLPPIDAAWIHLESPDAPTHVASLQIFCIPPHADATSFVDDVVAQYRSTGPALVEPFNQRLRTGIVDRALPAFVTTGTVDLDYHVRHVALPAPGGERQLGELISHLHAVPLDRSRPLWTCHVIAGLSDNRFAIYTKIHHSLTDGVNGIRMVDSALADRPDGRTAAPWHHQRRPRGRYTNATNEPAIRALSWPITISRGMIGLLARGRGADIVRRPFEAPPSMINGAVTPARRIATQQIELHRLQVVARSAGVSANDVFLAVCSAALRRHLLNETALPTDPLIAGVPVSLRSEGEIGGNAVAMVWASLATHLADPVERLNAIHVSASAAKRHLGSMPLPVRRVFSVITAAPVTAALVTGIGATRRPPMNVVISNVPGSPVPRYLNGARREALYPASLLAQGQALNITSISYADQFNISFTGARDAIPHLQRMAGYTSDALTELETALGITTAIDNPATRKNT